MVWNAGITRKAYLPFALDETQVYHLKEALEYTLHIQK